MEFMKDLGEHSHPHAVAALPQLFGIPQSLWTIARTRAVDQSRPVHSLSAAENLKLLNQPENVPEQRSQPRQDAALLVGKIKEKAVSYVTLGLTRSPCCTP